MSKDLKHRVPGFQQKKKTKLAFPRLGWVLLAVAALAGLAAMILPRYLPMSPQTSPSPPALPVASMPEPQFSFFKLLPDSERKIPESEINSEKREVRLGKTPVAGQYFLQLGAFRSQEQAEALKARLEEFAKLKPRLEQIKLEYASWYRVKLGPYQTIPDANQVRLFLRDRKIDSIMQAPAN